jgi:putative thioredoxin
MSAIALDVGEADFEREVIEASHRLPVVVDFWAEWCGPCRQLAPILEQAVADRKGAVKLVKVDTDANQQLAAALRIQGIPAVKGIRDGRIVSEFTGVVPRPEIDRFLDALLPSATETAAAEGDEEGLRAALAEHPDDAEAAIPLARLLMARGDALDALAVLDPARHVPAADGLHACAELQVDPTRDIDLAAALGRLPNDPAGAMQAMLDLIPGADDERRDRIRRVMIGVFAEREADDPLVLEYRRKLASALF